MLKRKLAMDVCTKTGMRLQEVTQSYLGAMNTCPSDSKVFGRRDSKSATETGKIIQGKRRTENTGRLLRNKLTSAALQKVQERSGSVTIATLRNHGGIPALATMVPSMESHWPK